MISFIQNIRNVSKYESKLLVRSWFFRIFAILAIAVMVVINLVALLQQTAMWEMIILPSNIPYINMLLMNTGQAVIAIFLASDFLKRDRKLDTSEIFYVRPLSNAEYVFGKIWGNLRIFFILNLIATGISVTFAVISPDAAVDWRAYIFYFLTISIPTIIYIIGISILAMMIMRNQAITFVLLLGYIGATIFYLKDKFYYLFDYMVYSFPMMKSTIAGFPNLEDIIVHRMIYLFAGLACIFITVPLFGRLPNSSKGNYPWIILSLCTMFICVGAGYRHVEKILQQNENRRLYTQINNKYVHTPKMIIEQYDISVKQNRGTFASETKMTGITLAASQRFTFCLNPGLKIDEVRSEGRNLKFEREQQILLIDFGREIPVGDTVTLSVIFNGKLDNSFCYLDIPEEELNAGHKVRMVSIDKQYSFLTDDYMLLTPETYWYPRPGTGYSDESPDWQQTYFSRFALHVTPLPGLIPLSQGESVENTDGSYSFLPEYPMQAISLTAGRYRQKSCVRDSIRYSVWHIEGNDVFYATALDSIRDTIPAIIDNFKKDMERRLQLEYPFSRFSIIEVPVQFTCYPHSWSQAQETVQPEIAFIVERGFNMYQMYVKKNVENNLKRNNGHQTPQGAQMDALRNMIYGTFFNQLANVRVASERGKLNMSSGSNSYYIFPQFFNFRYNIFSTEWTVANRLIELYLQDDMDDGWTREINGINNFEKANILLERQTFKELLADSENRNMINEIVALKASQLFAPAEVNIGVRAVRDSMYSILKNYTFQNIRLENILDTLGRMSGIDILSSLPAWNEPVKLAVYSVGEPEVIAVNDRGTESIVVKVIITNSADCDGIVHVDIDVPWEDPRNSRKIVIPARRSMQLVYICEAVPDHVSVNTMNSRNLPMTVDLFLRDVTQRETRKLVEKDEDILLPEDYSDIVPDEVIVDNEDSTLFSISKKPVIGLLPKLLENPTDTQFKYSGFIQWMPPLQWTATTNGRFYGKYIRSAYFVRGVKDGDQTATWKIPVPSHGEYELYYHVFKTYDSRDNRRRRDKNLEYHFKVAYGEDVEDAYLDMSKALNGWERVGAYHFASDTVSVTLSNENEARCVIADAVKIVKR
jgi:ABC-type transport system involved in multi-copper enzyme maturation permease subunit